MPMCLYVHACLPYSAAMFNPIVLNRDNLRLWKSTKYVCADIVKSVNQIDTRWQIEYEGDSKAPPKNIFYLYKFTALLFIWKVTFLWHFYDFKLPFR